jgi:hypothetical protein
MPRDPIAAALTPAPKPGTATGTLQIEEAVLLKSPIELSPQHRKPPSTIAQAIS